MLEHGGETGRELVLAVEFEGEASEPPALGAAGEIEHQVGRAGIGFDRRRIAARQRARGARALEAEDAIEGAITVAGRGVADADAMPGAQQTIK